MCVARSLHRTRQRAKHRPVYDFIRTTASQLDCAVATFHEISLLLSLRCVLFGFILLFMWLGCPLPLLFVVLFLKLARSHSPLRTLPHLFPPSAFAESTDGRAVVPAPRCHISTAWNLICVFFFFFILYSSFVCFFCRSTVHHNNFFSTSTGKNNSFFVRCLSCLWMCFSHYICFGLTIINTVQTWKNI